MYKVEIKKTRCAVSCKTFRISSVGCRSNQYEAQAFRNQLETVGYREAVDGEVCDICIINTCTVTASADRSSRYYIRQMVKKNPGATVIVTGCMASKAADIEGVSYIVPNKDKENLLSLISDGDIPEFSIAKFHGNTRAFVKIQDGCNSFCSYCIIPYVRGRSRSRPIVDIVREVEVLVANGHREVVFTGINIGDFGEGGNSTSLSCLVRAVDAVEGLERLRLSSIDPSDVNDDLFDAIIGGRSTCNSLHLVLQSGSNAVLKKMNRKYTRQDFLSVVDRFRADDPDFMFTTDCIVGFPGETDDDFRDTVDVVERVGFSHVHMFPFSVRPGVAAEKFSDRVPIDIIKRRKETLLNISDGIAHDVRDRYVGSKMVVLTENASVSDRNGACGHTGNFLPVRVKSHCLHNELVVVEITENTDTELIGKVV